MDVNLAIHPATELLILIVVCVKLDFTRLNRDCARHATIVVILVMDPTPLIAYLVILHKIDRMYLELKLVRVMMDTSKMPLQNSAFNVILFA